MKQSAVVLTLALCAMTATALTTTREKHHNHKKGKTVRMGKHIQDSGPRSLWMSRHGGMGKGHNLNIGGDVWPTSIYWTTVQVGTPLKTYAVAIDSGSPSLFLSGKNCDGCVLTPPNYNQYNPAESSTSSPLGTNFSATYETCNPTHPLESCTISGPKYTDMVSLAGYGPAQIHMGAIEYQTTNFYQFQTVDGIMGMVGGPANTNVFTTVCINDGMCEPVWGLCMHEGIFSNGTITIGGVDPSLADGPIEWVPSTNQTQWHEVLIPNITVAGVTIKNPGNPTSGHRAILDTGTNNLLLPSGMFNATQSAICDGGAPLAHCDAFFASPLKCHSLTEAEVDAYPDLTLNLEGGVKLHMTARDYLLKGSPAASSAGQFCMGLSPGGDFFIIGDTVMQNYYLVFGEQHVGWGKVNKQTCGSY